MQCKQKHDASSSISFHFILYLFILVCPLKVDMSAFWLSASSFVLLKHFKYLCFIDCKYKADADAFYMLK